MLEVGKIYENHNGLYEVLTVAKNGVATIQYEGSNGTASGTADMLLRIHQNIQAGKRHAEPKRRTITITNTKAYISPVDLRIFVEQLKKVHCSIIVRCAPTRFDEFAHQYRMITGKDALETDKDVYVEDYYRKGVGMSIQFPRTVHPPAGFSCLDNSGQWRINSTSLVWELFREGFYIGLNLGTTEEVCQ